MIPSIALAVLFLVVLYLHDRERKSWTAERQLLLERIQRPERVQVTQSSEEKEPLETDAPALALVGRIEEDFSPPRKEA